MYLWVPPEVDLGPGEEGVGEEGDDQAGGERQPEAQDQVEQPAVLDHARDRVKQDESLDSCRERDGESGRLISAETCGHPEEAPQQVSRRPKHL